MIGDGLYRNIYVQMFRNGSRLLLIPNGWILCIDLCVDHVSKIFIYFFKFTLLHPMTKAVTPTMVKFVFNEMFLLFGVPQLCDATMPRKLLVELFRQIASDYGFKVW